MIAWGNIAKFAIVAGAIAFAIWWISGGQYAKGYTKGKADGERVATESITILRDKQEEELVERIKGEESTKRADLERQYREKERKHAAETLASQLRIQAALDEVAATRDGILDELRRTRADREVRARGQQCRVSQATGDRPPGGAAPGLLPGDVEEDLARGLGNAEELSTRYRGCRAEVLRLQGK